MLDVALHDELFAACVQGLLLVREAVAAFLEKRDDQPADPEHVFLTAGASEGIKTVLSMVIRDQSDGKSFARSLCRFVG